MAAEQKEGKTMNIGKAWNAGLIITGIVVAALALCGALRLLNAVLYRAGGIGVLIAVLALGYAAFRKKL